MTNPSTTNSSDLSAERRFFAEEIRVVANLRSGALVDAAVGPALGASVGSGESLGSGVSVRAPVASSLRTAEWTPASLVSEKPVWADAPTAATSSAPAAAPTMSTTGLFMALETPGPRQVGSSGQ